jgi:hypothetical protein
MDIIYGGRGEFSMKDDDKQTSEQPSWDCDSKKAHELKQVRKQNSSNVPREWRTIVAINGLRNWSLSAGMTDPPHSQALVRISALSCLASRLNRHGSHRLAQRSEAWDDGFGCPQSPNCSSPNLPKRICLIPFAEG